MARNWLAAPGEWGLSPANGPYPGRRWKITAPNHRRWICSTLDRHVLLDVVRDLHRAGVCVSGRPLDEPIPCGLIPDDVVEVPQRKCRACTDVLELARYDGAARTCRSCTGKLCRPRKSARPCPSCNEPRAGASIVDVPGIGLACPTCAAEAREAAVRAADVVVSPEPKPADSCAAKVRPTVSRNRKPAQLVLWSSDQTREREPQRDADFDGYELAHAAMVMGF